MFERSYAKVYEDAQHMEETRTRLASIGFGVRSVDLTVDQRRLLMIGISGVLSDNESLTLCGAFFHGR